MASEWAQASVNDNNDSGYYILRSVLQCVALILCLILSFKIIRYCIYRFLAYGKSNHARIAAGAYLVSHSDDMVKKLMLGSGDEILVTRSPLLNLAQLVVRCVERGSKEQFIALLQHFQAAIRLDDFLFTVGDQRDVS